jgi:hypothetical protein
MIQASTMVCLYVRSVASAGPALRSECNQKRIFNCPVGIVACVRGNMCRMEREERRSGVSVVWLSGCEFDYSFAVVV